MIPPPAGFRQPLVFRLQAKRLLSPQPSAGDSNWPAANQQVVE